MGPCWRAAALAVIALAGVAAGCDDLNTPTYFAAPAALEAGGTDALGMPLPDGTGSVILLFRQPTAAEQKQIDADQQRLGFDVPWLQRDRLHNEILYTVKNLDTVPGVFTVRVDGANEYTKYDETAVAAAFTAQGEDPVTLPLMRSGPQTVAPGATVQGTLREDDVVEASLDLYAMGKWMAPFASVLINRSDVNPVGLEMVPKNAIIPAMFEFDVAFSADKHMTCSFLVRVRDDDGRLYQKGNDALFMPTPATYAPMVPPKQ
ncbi:MAG TPA: hypothetical protein VH374_24405 [Polyangia bacterium]|jgi:hypothetical protein|nr:hypothetical protein [Polyangia bacterium]